MEICSQNTRIKSRGSESSGRKTRKWSSSGMTQQQGATRRTSGLGRSSNKRFWGVHIHLNCLRLTKMPSQDKKSCKDTPTGLSDWT